MTIDIDVTYEGKELSDWAKEMQIKHDIIVLIQPKKNYYRVLISGDESNVINFYTSDDYCGDLDVLTDLDEEV